MSNELLIQQHLRQRSHRDPNANFVHLPRDTFILDGPNGTHVCFVTEPTGPSICGYLNPPIGPTRRFPTPLAKRFLRDVLEGLRFLHGNGVVHGDLQPGNLLFSLRDLSAFGLAELGQDVARARLDPLARVEGEEGGDRRAPRYLAAVDPLADEALPQEQQVVKLTDLGGGKLPPYYYYLDNVTS